jgi:hypothetical protein
VSWDHSTVDILLGIGAIASPLIAGLGLFFVGRVVQRRDSAAISASLEQTKQGDRINRHTAEIRHLQQHTNIPPFDPNWDR